MRQLLTAGFIDHIAARKDVVDKRAATGTKVASSHGVHYRAMNIEEDVFIHPSSAIAQQTAPEWIVYQDVVRTSKVWLKGGAGLTDTSGRADSNPLCRHYHNQSRMASEFGTFLVHIF